MPEAADRDTVRRLVAEEGATVAEVLPEPEYRWAHLAGAVHLPFKGWDPAEVAARFPSDRPLVVYCNDLQ